MGWEEGVPSTSKPNFKTLPLHRGSSIYGTPTMYVDIMNQADFSSYDLSSLRGGGVGPRMARHGEGAAAFPQDWPE